MKNIFLGMAVLALLFATSSCNNETIEKPASDDQITFRSALGKQTKATEFTNTSWENGNSFVVYAYKGGTWKAFDQFTLTYADSEWTYKNSGNESSVDQPGYSLTYNTWYPQDASATYTAPTESAPTATLAYTVPATAALQKDLIATSVSTGDANVELAFSHLLSQVNFAVLDIEFVKITLSNIKINSVMTKGTYTFGSGWGTPNTALSTSTPYVYTPVANRFPTSGNPTDGGIVYLGNKGGTTQTDNNNGNALMLMPQTFADADDGTITFDYVLTDMGSTPTTIGSGSATANLCDFDVTTWVAGRRYLYLIDFTNYFKTGVIKFTVDVADWEDADEYKVATTLEVAQANKVSIEGAIATHNAAKTGDLKVFPISLPEATTLTANIALDLTKTNAGRFVAGDVIKIQCYNTTNAGHIELGTGVSTYWTLDNSKAVVTLTRTATAY